MPTSDPSAISHVLTAILDLDPLPRTVLDVGPGYGKYGFLLREYLGPVLHRLDAIEAWPQGMFGMAPLLYDSVIHAAYPDGIDRTYDLILMIDVLEHYEEPVAPLVRAMRGARSVVLSTPHAFAEQGAVNGNPYETHRSTVGRSTLLRAGAERVTEYHHPRQFIAAIHGGDPQC